ncbi:MAG TPA: ABC transporter ATP-binding protein [Acidimicrobiales bacterium]|jgi:ABC-2 type transport system ATP-binding protein|nr:ABC transporter ATP-binding protein [Acidimicrobiales bacterium]
MPSIEVQDLVVRYGARVAVDRVSFVVDPGEVVALLGRNGAGKTTTVETLEGYRRPDEGRVRVLGLDPVAHHDALVGRIGVMLQGGGLYPMMPPERAIRLFAAYYEHPRDPAELVELLGLAEVARTPAKRLSGGERQRLSLALALVGRPEVVFLDEPTAGVDPSGRLVIRRVVADLRAEGAAVLLTTHELAEAERIADRVVILERGRVVASGAPGDLAAPEAAIRFAASGRVDLDALGEALHAPVTEEAPGRYRVAAVPDPTTVATLTAWLADHDVALADLRTGGRSLEEVFLELVGPDGDGLGAR